jgi:uncharacterized protein YjiS (DUF1127 family)
MVATTGNDRPARGAAESLLYGARRLLQALFGLLFAERQRAANRRILQELPDHLLKDMGISRTELGTPARVELPSILRDAGAWR